MYIIHMKNSMVFKKALVATTILLALLITSCEGASKDSSVVTVSPETQVNSIDTTEPVITASILIAYKKDVTSKSIKEFEKTLPEHVKKSLGSKIMFSYRFLSIDNIEKAQSTFKTASIVESISHDKAIKMDPGF